ncbi:MAG: glycosyl transferase family 2 [Gammaproteobacteria bacterium]|nr:glycosyl transferase family 2 [Gammaproteobacteria bacterium]
MKKFSDIAIIIPVFHDTSECCALINYIRSWEQQPREIIVISGEEDTELYGFCTDNGCAYYSTHACRGAQLDMGAKFSTAPILWFLHADSTPHYSSLSDITTAHKEECDGGHFKFKFTGTRSWKKIFFEYLVSLRIRLGGIPYGDQGLFMRRQNYFNCGGFYHQSLFEEVNLVRKLRKKSRFRSLKTAIGVSPRRWQKKGWIKQSLINRSLAIRYILGVPAEQLALRYDQIDSRLKLNKNQETDV